MTKEEVAEYWRTAYCNEKHKKEELEKQLAISEHDREHNDYELTEVYKKVAELEAQIEKMKCCGNCAKRGHICVAEEIQGKLCGKSKDKWELREIKEKWN